MYSRLVQRSSCIACMLKSQKANPGLYTPRRGSYSRSSILYRYNLIILTVLISSNRLLLFARVFYLTTSGNQLARCIKSRRDYYQRKSCPSKRELVAFCLENQAAFRPICPPLIVIGFSTNCNSIYNSIPL